MLERGLERRNLLVERTLELARIGRELAAFKSDIAAARSRIGEHRISLSRLDATRLEEIVTELREVDIEALDLDDELRMVDDDLARINVIAPVDGIVHASTVHTPGAVIQLDGLTLVPGMPAEVFVQTGERTPLSYLLKPLSDHIRRAMREE